jgi:hypothetical protein
MSMAEDRGEGAKRESHLERLVKEVFEEDVQRAAELADDDRAAVMSLFGLLMNKAKIAKHQAAIGAPPGLLAAYELVAIGLHIRRLTRALSVSRTACHSRKTNKTY